AAGKRARISKSKSTGFDTLPGVYLLAKFCPFLLLWSLQTAYITKQGKNQGESIQKGLKATKPTCSNNISVFEMRKGKTYGRALWPQNGHRSSSPVAATANLAMATATRCVCEVFATSRFPLVATRTSAWLMCIINYFDVRFSCSCCSRS
ncbi:hypothetical protein M5D96_003119, partial [Drosophila gunungcola]